MIIVTKSTVSKIVTMVYWLVTLTMTIASWVRLTPQPILQKIFILLIINNNFFIILSA